MVKRKSRIAKLRKRRKGVKRNYKDTVFRLLFSDTFAKFYSGKDIYSSKLIKLPNPRLVDELGSVVILKDNAPRYLVIDFNKADESAVADGSLEYEGMLKWVLEHQE